MAYLKERLGGYVRPVLVAVALGVCLSTIMLWAIFQGLLLPNASGGLPLTTPASTVPIRMTTYYLALLLLTALSAMTVQDLGKSLGTYLVGYLFSGIIVYSLLVYPETGDPVYGPGFTIAAATWTFQALFPFTLFAGFLGTIIGYALSERILG